jgi:hypothetical protein
MPDQIRNLPHLRLEGNGLSQDYTSPRRPFTGLPPSRVRAEHAQSLLVSLGTAILDAQLRLEAREASNFEGERGFYLQFDIPVEHRDALDGLAQPRKGIEIVAVQPVDGGSEVVRSTVFVPEQAADHFIKKVEQYRDEESRGGQPKNQKLVASIDDVRLGDARAIFTDDMALFPTPQQQAWWEVWIREDRLSNFLRAAAHLEIVVKEHALEFVERTVVLALATPEQLQILIESSDAVAELRIAKDMPSFFLEMGPREAADWARDLADRIQISGPNAPAVCVLDSGATRAHPVLVASLDPTDQHTYDLTWGVSDSSYWNGHGTAMCGVALLGDVQTALMQAGPIHLGHRLETVKILPPREQNDPALYGIIVAESIAKVERHMPLRRRVYCMAVSSDIGLSRGRPSAWSAAIDEICYGGGTPRLMVTAAGNLREEILAEEYPAANDLAEVENPSQAWNALVVGAYTDKITITHDDYFDWIALAPAGELSPASRTSTVWDKQWPIRPDVVFEGGNFGHDGVNPASAIDDLQSLTTHYRPQNRLFQTFGDTSGATALCANMAARIMAARPELLPETVRGLIVHSAEWTPAMRARFDQANFNSKRALLRRYGWGVPNVERALLSTATDATLMVEDTLKPFRIEGTLIKSRHMNLHRLPWPRDELLSLVDHDVELRVTLSYFVEPNPGERGWNKRHKYASHGLRFAVKRALEQPGEFQRRINRAAEIEEQGQARVADQGGGDGWVVGTLRDRGSIHSDIWRGTAADLATRDAIAVYPVGGWWKEKRDQENRWDRTVRYALLVSIRAAGADTDIYTPIATQIGVAVPAA